MASVEYEAIPTISINGPEECNGDVSDEQESPSSPEPVATESLVNHVDENSESEDTSSDAQLVDSDVDRFAQSIVENVLLSSIANMYVEKIIENVKKGIVNGEYPEFKPVLVNGVNCASDEPMGKSQLSISDEDDVCIDSDNSDHVNDSMSALLEEQRERLGEDALRNEPERLAEKLRAQGDGKSGETEAVDEPAKTNDVHVIVDDKIDNEKTDRDSGGKPDGLLSEPVCPVTTNLIPATPEKESVSTPNDDSDQILEDTPTDKNEEQEGAKAAKHPPKEIPKENAIRAKKKKKRMSSFRKLFTCCAAGRSSD